MIVKLSLKFKACILMLLTMSHINVVAQNGVLDSLEHVVKTYNHQDSTRVKTMILFAKELYRKGNPDRAILIADSARIISYNIEYWNGVGNAWLASGYANFRKNDYETALKHFENAKGIFQREKNSDDLARAYTFIGQVYDFLAEYEKAMENYRIALDLLKDTKDQMSLASLLNSIGNYYYNRSSYERAIYYYYRSLEISERLKSTRLMASIFNNMGAAYIKMENHAEALNNYQRALEYLEESGNKSTLALTKTNIGGVYVTLRSFDEAEKYINEAIEIQHAIGDKRGLILSYSNQGSLNFFRKQKLRAEGDFLEAIKLAQEIGDDELMLYPYLQLVNLYIHSGRHAEANQYLQISRSLSQNIGTAYWLQQNYLWSSRLDSARGNFAGAYKWHKEYTVLKDSLLSYRKSEQIAQMKEVYESVKKDNEINRLKEDKHIEEIKRASREKILLVSLVAGCIVIGGLMYGLKLKSKTAKLLASQLETIQNQSDKLAKQNERLEELHQEKDGFIGIIAHDLRSPLSKATGLASLVPLCGTVTEEQQDLLNRVRTVCEDGNKLINDLLEINQVENETVTTTKIQLPDFIQDILKAYTAQLQNKNLELHFECNVEGKFEMVTDSHYLARIVDNLVSNAIKFSPVGKKIFTKLAINGANVSFTVKDEGQGIREEEMVHLFKKFKKLSARPTGGETSTGLGLSIVKLLTEKLNGNIAVESAWGKGAAFTINLPITA